MCASRIEDRFVMDGGCWMVGLFGCWVDGWTDGLCGVGRKWFVEMLGLSGIVMMLGLIYLYCDMSDLRNHR